VIVALGLGNREPHRHIVEKPRISYRNAFGREVVAYSEADFICPDPERGAAEQGLVRATVGIRDRLFQEPLGTGVALFEHETDASGWLAVHDVEHVRR